MLKTGDKIPSIRLEGSDDNSHTLSEFIGKPLVVFFYPKNETPGCVAEVCAFRDQFEDFTQLGAAVVGISADSISSHKSFIKNRRLPFLLLSDPRGQAEKAFKIKRPLFGLLPGRVTFVFNEKGELIYSFNSSTNPTKHIKMALDSLKRIQHED
jgi:peroxiredoxin Q/BCP